MACDPLPSHGVCRLSNPFNPHLQTIRSPSPTHHSKCDVQTICRSPRVMCKHSGSAPLPVVAALCYESRRLLFLPFPSSSTKRPKLLAWCHTRKRRHSFSLGQTWMASTHALVWFSMQTSTSKLAPLALPKPETSLSRPVRHGR